MWKLLAENIKTTRVVLKYGLKAITLVKDINKDNWDSYLKWRKIIKSGGTFKSRNLKGSHYKISADTTKS